jgi:sugar phosphate isomerase/epimerase
VRIALFTDIFPEQPLPQVLDWLAGSAPEVTAVEIGTGGYSPVPHCDPQQLLADANARTNWLDQIRSRGFELAALNVSGNPLHPDPAQADAHDRDLRDCIRLAAALGVDRIVAMSGCPGAGPSDRERPHFAAGGWLPDLEDVADWQWRERVLPYWSDLVDFIEAEHPELRLCFELHPGTYVYNTTTFRQIAQLGRSLAINLDPSHFFWQSIDPLAVVRELGPHIGFASGKDTRINRDAVALNGLLDNRWPHPIDEMPWTFASVGRGHDRDWWASFLAALAAAGFDGTISIEHEDPSVSPEEGIAESARLFHDLQLTSTVVDG